ncbi:MAG: alpha/beta hydrolase [Chloroflexi bacterium]|nr:alpha/beta hydrolase [Chloroflexota bacterium]
MKRKLSFRPRPSFEQLYARVDEATRCSLQTFRRDHPPRTLEVDGQIWEYVVLGEGERTILYLHGMAGAYDIWWQQMLALAPRWRQVAVTYPPVDHLHGLERGLLAILEQEGIARVNVVGSSLGGYLAQYLVAHHPQIIERAVFANTFPPSEQIAQSTRGIGRFLPYLPEWVIMRMLRRNIAQNIYPASGHSELVAAFLLEQAHGKMSKAQFVSRYRCVIQPFTPPAPEALETPILIIEADNDPLVGEPLREQLKATYPSASVHTLHGAGHFPYLNEPEAYTRILEQFLSERA